MAFGDFTVARNSPVWTLGSNGLLQETAVNTPAFEFNPDGTYKGLLVQPQAQNLAVHSRDLSNAVWVKTNATATRTATGANGVANEGSIVTATAGNATVLQAITSASSARNFSARVRRRTGTGTVEMTQDNGATWQVITLTSTYKPFTVTPATLANPTVGFRIVTSGDAIDVDFTQAETGSVATSPIPTVASTVTRLADNISLTGASSLIGQTEGTLYAECEMRDVGAVARSVFDINNGTTGTRASIVATAALSNTFRIGLNSGGFVQCAFDSAFVTDTVYKITLAYKVDDFASYINGVSIGTDNLGTVPAFSEIRIGSLAGGISHLNGWIRSAALFPTRLTNAQLQAMTTL